MGVIKKQSISGSIYSYIGVGLGFIVSGILLPRLLKTEEVGLLRLLVSYSTLMAQFAVLGFNSVTIKLFPLFRDEKKKHHGFLGLVLLISLVGFLITVLVYIGMHNYVIENAKEKSTLFINYYYYVIPMVFFTMVFGIFDTYYRVLYNATKGIVYKEIVQRLLIIISILLYYFELVDFKTLVLLYTIAIISPALFLLGALIKDKQLFLKPEFGFIDKKMTRQMMSVALFGIVASYSGVIVMNTDLIMVSYYLGLSLTGIYTINFFFGSLILVPLRTMGKIVAIVISEAWQKNDRNTIIDIYHKSSLTLSVIGLLLLIGIWGNVDNIFRIIGPNYELGKYVILFIGIGNLFDVALGTSSQIIVNSPKYKWQSYLLLFFVTLVILTNIIFIPIYGIVGAAIASMISKFLFNFSRFLFLYIKYKFQPFTAKHIYLLILGIGVWFVSTLIPPFDNFIIDIILRSLLISFLFVTGIYFLKISHDINTVIDNVLAP